MRTTIFLTLAFLCSHVGFTQKAITAKRNSTEWQIESGAEQINSYVPFLKEKRVGIFANQTSMVGKKHLIDTLLSLGVDIRVIFGPEHGFRGTADAGEKVGDYIDKETGIPVVSLYGAKRGPEKKDLEEVDILVFDIQDVGVRFYTF
ncbi:MAG: exo-beta-N-acetylmuramidase NamZ domain-containing protein, partial [Bacteroidota bacterium]